jgi:hypothetical protein
MNGAFLGNLEQPSPLPLVQRSDQLEAQLDPIEHRIYVFAISAILSVNPLVSQPHDDLFERPFPPRGVHFDSHRRATAERHQQQFVGAGSGVSASGRYRSSAYKLWRPSSMICSNGPAPVEATMTVPAVTEA